MAAKNFLLHLAKTGFRSSDADGIQLEDDTRGTIILDGVEPFPANVFFVREDTAENLVGNLDVTITARNGAAISTDQAKFGSASVEFDGSNDSLRTSDIVLGTSNFTFEAFIRLDVLTGFQYLLDGTENVGSVQNPVMYLTSTNVLVSYQGGTIINVAHGLSVNTWHHIALVRDGTNSFKVFVDGTLKGSATPVSTYDSTARNYSIGNNFTESFGLNGYMDEIRLTKRAVYTSAFTPPTAAFNTGNENDQLIIHAEGVDGSTNIINGLGTEQVTGGDVIALEDQVSDGTNRLLHETSIVTFRADQVLSVGEKLLQNNPTNESTIPLSEFIDIPFKEIRREARIINEQPSELLENDKLTPKFIAERDGVTPLQTEDGSFIRQEDATHNSADDPNRSLTTGAGDIDSGGVHEEGILLEQDDGFISIDQSDENGTDADSYILTEDAFRIIREDQGVIVQESFDPSSHIANLLMEGDTTTITKARLEKSDDPEPIDGVLLESSTPGSSFYVRTEANERLINEQDFDDIAARIDNILLEESHTVGNTGQIPLENYSIGVDQDRPLGLIKKGSQPIVQSAYISLSTS